MIPSKHSRSLYFTPRTPWGRLPQNRHGQSYLRASQDAPLPPKQGLGGKILNPVKKVAQWAGEHLFGGVGVDKHFGAGEPADKSIVAGVHLGGEGKPKEWDPAADNDEAKNKMLHVNEKRTTNDRLKYEQEDSKPKPQHPGQKMFPGASNNRLDEIDAKFKESLRKSGIDPTGKSLYTPQS